MFNLVNTKSIRITPCISITDYLLCIQTYIYACRVLNILLVNVWIVGPANITVKPTYFSSVVHMYAIDSEYT